MSFLPHSALHSVDYAVERCMFVYLVVCLSVTFRYSVKMDYCCFRMLCVQ